MNQVGIGELKNAKPTARSAALKERSPLSRTRRILQNQKPGEVEQEGQLSVDIVQREDQMIIICPIAGVEKSEVKVAIQDDVLTIRGERKPIEGIEAKEALVRSEEHTSELQSQ